MHADEVETDPSLVQRLIAGQFPEWADLPIEPVFPLGTDNANYRLGADKLVRLPRQESKVAGLERELEWLPGSRRSSSLPCPRRSGAASPPRDIRSHGVSSPGSRREHRGRGGGAGDRLRSRPADPRGREFDATHAPQGSGTARCTSSTSGFARMSRSSTTRTTAPALLAAWEETLEAPAWDGPPTWCHCDLDLRNVVFRGGRPSGRPRLGLGRASAIRRATRPSDGKMLPAESRPAFFEALGADEAGSARARGWTLMQWRRRALVLHAGNNPALYFEAERWLGELLADSSSASR
jgi:aminoglycoside phosphotransferase (APT) family kinase protein